MKGVLYKTAIWVTKYQSGERSRKLNVGFAKVFFLAKVHDTTKIYVNYIHVYAMGPCQSAYSSSLFRPPAAAQISSPFFAKASMQY